MTDNKDERPIGKRQEIKREKVDKSKRQRDINKNIEKINIKLMYGIRYSAIW